MTTKNEPAARWLATTAAGRDRGPMEAGASDLETIIALHAQCSKAVISLGGVFAATIDPERIDRERLRRALATAYADWQVFETAANEWFAAMAEVDLATVFDASMEAR